MNHLSHRALVGLGCCAVALFGWLTLAAEPSAAQPPSGNGTPTTSPLSGAPAVALVATIPGDDASRLYVARPGEPLPPPVLEFRHLPSGSVRAEVWSDDPVVLATAPTTPSRDPSFDGGLYRLDPAAGAQLLCDGVVHAARPLITPDGRVFVARGMAGPSSANPAAVRVDELTIDEVDPLTGVVTPVHHHTGHLAHLAGWHDGRLLVYQVGPGSAEIVAVSPATGKTTVLVASLPAFARDFSVDPVGGQLVYRGRHEDDPRRWVVDTLDLAKGARQRLYEGDSFSLAPHVWPGGGVAINPRRRGLQLLGSGDGLVSPMGSGVDLVRGVSQGDRYVALLHTVQGRLPLPFVVDRQTSGVAPVPTPPGTRVAVAGFVSAKGGTP
ncbi:MAG: hypothetical protein JRI68_10615 [Deltaproteobacteria bacterium]|nr:hypothetical protein [Deltaproteobacteria bacterium]